MCLWSSLEKPLFSIWLNVWVFFQTGNTQVQINTQELYDIASILFVVLYNIRDLHRFFNFTSFV